MEQVNYNDLYYVVPNRLLKAAKKFWGKTVKVIKDRKCKYCSSKPNKAIFVEDVYKPKCSHCGKNIL